MLDKYQTAAALESLQERVGRLKELTLQIEDTPIATDIMVEVSAIQGVLNYMEKARNE